MAARRPCGSLLQAARRRDKGGGRNLRACVRVPVGALRNPQRGREGWPRDASTRPPSAPPPGVRGMKLEPHQHRLSPCSTRPPPQTPLHPRTPALEFRSAT
ncbi:uncharacterized protein LOC135110413 isoform X2 [Scylla paramamosain]|uniref:uncharacterized protein LOC135110413 isoform X2 n=1 Tax=Scylla paramamosain TaxID=85552 RepID=UPI0030831CCE